MVEVHLMRLECLATVHARNPSQSTEEFKGRALPAHDPIDLALTVTTVVAHVVGALIARVRHVGQT